MTLLGYLYLESSSSAGTYFKASSFWLLKCDIIVSYKLTVGADLMGSVVVNGKITT